MNNNRALKDLACVVECDSKTHISRVFFPDILGILIGTIESISVNGIIYETAAANTSRAFIPFVSIPELTIASVIK